VIDRLGEGVRLRRHEAEDLDVDVRPVFFDRPLPLPVDAGKANSGRSSSPLSANQCQFSGFPPSGSQKAVAGTRHRRFAKLSFQNFARALSSRW
jgi:hypothetical protein